ncbi:MAG: Fe-S cluster assembly protein SufB, partial [Bacteroidales bacterium]
MNGEQESIISQVTQGEYKYGFVTDLDNDELPKGLNEDIIRRLSAKKEEPEWLLDIRLKAYRYWLTMKLPD